MKRKICAIVFCVLMVLALTGCQLAREDVDTNVIKDKLVGVFITTAHLDLFDMEGYLNDNLKGFQGSEITVNGDTEKYQGRLYAALTTKTLTSEETGETSKIEDYVFPIDGISYFSATVPAKGNHDSYLTSISDPAISDGHVDYKVGDDSDRVTLTGTIYVSPTGMEHSFFFNPVYQSADGSIYLTAGTGITAPMDSEDAAISRTMDAMTTTTENGKTKTDSISITLSVTAMFAPTKIVVLQMDEKSTILSQAEYAPDAMPVNIPAEPKTAYLIIETHQRNNMGQIKISREIYGSNAENIETFLVREDGICLKQWTQIKWAESVTTHLIL